MRILHFIPDVPGEAARPGQYKVDLLRAMAGDGAHSVHVLSPERIEGDLGRVQASKYSPLRMLLRGRVRGFARWLGRMEPDIVHVHACWDRSAYRFMEACRELKVPVVLTVDKGLEPWHMAGRLPWLRAYQRSMVRGAQALHATSAQEAGTLERLRARPRGWLPDPERVVTIERFDLSCGMDARAMAERLVELYRKVADSHPFMGMTGTERAFEDELLVQGMMEGGPRKNIPPDTVRRMRGAGRDTWRRILLHSVDEGILDYVMAGARLAGLEDVEAMDVSGVERFAQARPQVARKAESGEAARLRADGSVPAGERDLLLSFLGALRGIGRGALRRSDLAALSRRLRFGDYDEDVLAQAAERLGIGAQAARLLCILGERYGLGPGFMFLEPLDDRRTEKMRKKLYLADIQ